MLAVALTLMFGTFVFSNVLLVPDMNPGKQGEPEKIMPGFFSEHVEKKPLVVMNMNRKTPVGFKKLGRIIDEERLLGTMALNFRRTDEKAVMNYRDEK